MKRILFVDDEKNILDGLRRSLHRQRKQWEMVFAEGGAKALEELAASPFDAVITDMRMPGMDGAELLREVKERCPDTVRIVLSGQSEEEAALRTVPTAHQFLSKPCDVAKLREVIERACRLRDLLADSGLRSAVGEVDALPTLPRTYAELKQRLEDPEVSVGKVADVIEQDISISAKVLQIVNSAFFGLSQKISDVRGAVSYLGLKTIEAVTLSVEIFRPYEGCDQLEAFSLEWLQKHAYVTSQVAKRLIKEREQSDEACLAGMVHDIGKLVLVTQRPDDYARALGAVREQGLSLDQAESEFIGASHAQVGAYLLGIWGLPTRVVEAVAFRKSPQVVEHQSFDVLSALHVADALAYELMSPAQGAINQEESPHIDEEYLEKLHVAERLPEWREMAAGVVEAASSGH